MSSLEKHLPHFAEGTVVSGFGRGSKELGIPTANFPDDVIQNLPADFECGVYYGWAKLNSDENIYQMVMCVGWNPYYHNTVKTMETHIIHKFDHDFYGDHLKTIILGYIRPMCNFESLDALIAAIHKDIADAVEHLKEPACLQFSHHPFFSQSPAVTPPDRAPTEHGANSKPDLSSNCSITVDTGMLNGDIHYSYHPKQSSTKNGLVPTLHTDSTNLDRNVNHCHNTAVIHCESSHDIKGNHAKDKSYHSESEQIYGEDKELSFQIQTKDNVNQKQEISTNGHTESEENSGVCTLVI